MTDKECDPTAGIVYRRRFLQLGGTTVVTLTLPVYLRKVGAPTVFRAQRVDYPRQVIGRLSELKPGVPVSFKYPWDHPLSANILI